MRVLVIEDDNAMAEPLVQGLERHGFATSRTASGIEGAQLARSTDAVVLDLGLPDIDGLDVCRQIRAFSDVPIIIVSARGQEADRIAGLELGADDYVVKPFSIRELAARIRTNLRRHRQTDPIITIGSLTVDRSRRIVESHGQQFEVTPKEFDVLVVLGEEPGRVVPRAELYSRVWDPVWVGTGKSLDVHIATLRRKLPDSVSIDAVRGVGYRIVSIEQ